MANKKKTETAPEQEGAVLNQEVTAEAQTEAQAEAQTGVYEHKGVLYQFVDETPDTLSLDEGLFTQEEILLNHELMQSLIETNCIFIKQA